MNSILHLSYSNNKVKKEKLSSFSFAEDGIKAVFSTLSTKTIISRSDAAKSIGLNYEQAVIEADLHIERLSSNARELKILNENLTEHRALWIKETLLKNLNTYCRENKFHEQRIKARLILDSTSLIITLEPLRTNWPSDAIINCISVQAERIKPECKTTNIKASLYARKIMGDHGANEALLVNKDGYVTEGSYSNIFWLDKSTKLFTPKSDILPGITRKVVCKLRDCRERDIKLTDLIKQANEVFITQSTTGVTPVAKIDGISIGHGSYDETLKIKSEYEAYIDKNATPILLNENN